MAALLAAGLAAGLAAEDRRRGRDWTVGGRAGPVALALLAALAMALAVLASLSRGGAASLAAGGACLVALLLLRRGSVRPRTAAGGRVLRARARGGGRGARAAFGSRPAALVLGRGVPARHVARRPAPCGREPAGRPRARGLPRRVSAREAGQRRAPRRARRERVSRDPRRDRPCRPRPRAVRARRAAAGGCDAARLGVAGRRSRAARPRRSWPSPSTRPSTSTSGSRRTPPSRHSRPRPPRRAPACAACRSAARGPRPCPRRRSRSSSRRSWLPCGRTRRRATTCARRGPRGLRRCGSSGLERAEASLAAGLRLRPADAESWLMLAGVRAARGDEVSAAALARHAVSLDPQRANLLAAARALVRAEGDSP